MKVFLDDFRIPLDAARYMHMRIGANNPIYLDNWEVVKNYDEFVKVISENIDLITHVSFDHDLADEHYNSETWESPMYLEKTGLDCAKWMKEFYEQTKTDLPVIFIHSMNPIGTENIKNVFL
jgi:hypothetical protein